MITSHFGVKSVEAAAAACVQQRDARDMPNATLLVMSPGMQTSGRTFDIDAPIDKTIF